MNNDGWGFMGAGTSDNRLAGMDLQHNRQTRTADELHVPVRKVTQSRESGGPMKEYMDKEQHHNHHMHRIMEDEKERHEKAMEHHRHHLEKHQGRHFDKQHGQESYKY